MSENRDQTVSEGAKKVQPGRNGGTLKADAGPGRPKGSLSIVGLIRKELENNNEAKAKVLAKKLIEQAEKGNATAIRQIVDRIDGPIVEQIEATMKVTVVYEDGIDEE